jgi:hypothetical protein
MSPRASRLAFAALCVVHAGLLIGVSWHNFVTADEGAFLACGVNHWRTGTYHGYRVNPPLVRMIAAAPLFAAGFEWQGEFGEDTPGFRQEFETGHAFAEANASRYLLLLRLARLAGIGWSLLAAWAIWSWASDLYGPGAGLFGACLWCFGPNVFGHASLVTHDIPAASAAVVATYAFWRYLLAPSWAGAAHCGFLLGVAQLVKFTLLGLYVLWPLLALVAAFGKPGYRLRLGHAALVILLSLIVLNAGYEFTGTGKQLGELPFVSRAFTGESLAPGHTGNRFAGTWLGMTPCLVPEDFIRGIDTQRRDFEQFPSWQGAYLRGEWRKEGWWHYYLYGFLVKVPLGSWAAVLLALTLVVSSRPCAEGLAPWLAAAFFLALVSSQTGINHHVRYAFPVLPFAAIAAAGSARPGPRLRVGLAWAFLVLTAASSLSVWPRSLSYFNEAAGGPGNGPAHLLDSNIDWGQDLYHLKEWHDANKEARPLRLALFIGFEPELIGLDGGYAQGMPHPSASEEERKRCGPLPGWYAVSVNRLHGMGGGPIAARGTPHDGHGWFKLFKPVARIGWTIHIYHIRPDEAAEARRFLGLP